MKKIILSILMCVTICSSFILGGCACKEEDDNFSLEETKELFADNIRVLKSNISYELKENIDDIYYSNEYVAIVENGSLGFYGLEGYYNINDVGELTYTAYTETQILNNETYLDKIELEVEEFENFIANPKYAYYRGWFIDLDNGEWTLKNEDESKFKDFDRVDVVTFYDSYLNYELGDFITSISVKWCKNQSDSPFYDITIEGNKLRALNGFEFASYKLPKTSISSEIVESEGYGNIGAYVLTIENNMIVAQGNGGILQYFSSNLSTLIIDENIRELGAWAFNTYTDKLQLENIVVEGQYFYDNVLEGNTEYVRAKLESVTAVVPVIYLKDDVQVEENDYFKTFYQAAVTDKTGYIKYIKK